MTILKIQNTLENSKEVFDPIDSKNVRVYACGPTVYNYAHIGNARMAVVNDVLIRLLRLIYPKVTYVSNITDIDDKIIESANNQNIEIKTLTRKFEKIYNEDMSALGVENPDKQPRASEHINEMIELTKKLLDNKNAYEKNGHVLFHVPSFKNYGCLSKRNREEQIMGSRVEVAPFKKDPTDFVLWKPSSKNMPGWDSPWGFGRPGWHLECSAMSKKFLGDKFDIHGGGMDLIFPHHENEIAQSRCANEKDNFANYWVHNAFITSSNEKMSKSQGNILKISDFKNKVNGQVLRLALISAHYKQPLDWNDKLLSDCEKTINKWYGSYTDIKKQVLIPEDCLSPLYDDLNTPGYIANLHKLFEKSQKGSNQDKEIFVSACNFIGLLTENKNSWNQFKQDKSKISEDEIKQKIAERNNARKNKDYKAADAIRNELLDKGVLIEDKDDKTLWKFK